MAISEKMLNRLAVVFLILLGLWGVKGLWGADFFTSHDGWSHLSRLGQYVSLLKDGQIPPRWSTSLNGRLGYPIFIYSYHLPFLLGSFFYKLTSSLTVSLKLVMAIGQVTSGLGAYWWLSKISSKKAAFLGAVLFLIAPYRFVLIYVRAAIGEQMALSILPWILGSITKLIFTKNKSRWLGVTGLLLGLGLLAHSLFVLMYLPLVIVYGATLGLMKKMNKGELLKRLVGATILGVGIASFYLIPAAAEKKFIVFDSQYRGLAEGHLLALKQLIYSPWGYGFSMPGVESDAMSFQLGIAQQLIIVGGAGVLIYKWLKSMGIQKLDWVKKILHKGSVDKDKIIIVSLLIWLVVISLMTNWEGSRWFWKYMPLASIIDIPWRLTGLTLVASSLIGVIFLDYLKPRWKEIGLMAMVLISVYGNRNHWKVNQVAIKSDQEIFNDIGTTTFLNEYRPIWRTSGVLNLSEVEPNFYTLDQNDKINILEEKSNLLVAKTNFDQETELQINELYYPGWIGYLKKEGEDYKEMNLGKELIIVGSSKGTSSDFGEFKFNDIEGTMRVIVPEGNYEVILEFQETSLRLLANYLSFISLVIAGILISFQCWHKR